MITKGNDTKVQNEVIAQTITDESAKRLRLARLFPKQEIKENSDYYTYFRQNINLDDAIKRGLLGEAKDLAPGASLQELNIRKPVQIPFLLILLVVYWMSTRMSLIVIKSLLKIYWQMLPHSLQIKSSTIFTILL